MSSDKDSTKGTKEIKWYEPTGIKFRFIPVSPYMYQTIEGQINSHLILSEPVAPLVQQGSVSRQNKADAIYQDKKLIWEKYKAMVQEFTQADSAIIGGMVLKDKVPPKSTWLPDIVFQLDLAGISLEDATLPVSYMSEEKRLEFLYKKYVVLSDDVSVAMFTSFFNKNTKEALATIAQAVNMFRDDSEQSTDQRSKAK